LESEMMREKRRRVSKFSMIEDAKIGNGTIVHDQVNLYKCKIGKDCKIDAYVYIERDVAIGDNCKIRPFVFIPTGVIIENNVFIAPGVVFTNDKYPRVSGQWKLRPIRVKESASIGAGAVILPGVTIGKKAIIGAGAVVTKNVPDNAIVVGNPARVLRHSK